MTDPARAPGAPAALLTDLYQLTMVTAYHALGMERTAVFEFFVRRLPARRGFLVAAGLEQALDYLEALQFTEAELRWLESTSRFPAEALRRPRAWGSRATWTRCQSLPWAVLTMSQYQFVGRSDL